MISPKTNLQSPCLCGSGRKYKNCCWPVEKRTYAIARKAIADAHQALFSYALRNHEDLLDRVTREYCRKLLKQYGESAVEDFREGLSGLVEMNTADSFVSDFRLEDGSSVIDLFLEESGDSLHPAAREFLKNYRDTACSLYEITRVVRGSHFEVYDILSRRNLVVSDVSASETLERWQLYFFRLVECNGENLMAALQLNVPGMYLDYVERVLRREKEKRGKSLTWSRFLKKNWTLPPQLWSEVVGKPFDLSSMRNTDGEKISPVTTTYTLLPGTRARVMDALEAVPNVDFWDENSFSIIEERPGGQLDTVSIAGGTFTSETVFEVFTNSVERCERVERILRKHLAGLLSSVERKHEEMNISKFRKPGETGPSPGEEAPEIPPEMLQQVYRKVYANWSSQPIPLLGNITPKEAVKTPQGRKKVISLLKSYEVTPSGQKVDLSFLWEEVGLKRPD